MMNSSKNEQCDVLVIGGGAAGSLAAIRAGRWEQTNFSWTRVCLGGVVVQLASGALSVYMPGDDLEIHLKCRGDLINQKLAIKAVNASYDIFKRLEQAGVQFAIENGKVWRRESPSAGLDTRLLGGGPAYHTQRRRVSTVDANEHTF